MLSLLLHDKIQQITHSLQPFTFILLQSDVIYSLPTLVQSLSPIWLFATPWTAACQAFPSFTISQNVLKLMPLDSVMSSNHLILCHPLLLLPSIFPSIKVFLMSQLFTSGDQSFEASASVLEYSGLISFRVRFDLLAVQGTVKSLLQHQIQKHQFFSAQASLWSNSHIHTWLVEKPYLWLDRPLLAK